MGAGRGVAGGASVCAAAGRAARARKRNSAKRNRGAAVRRPRCFLQRNLLAKDVTGSRTVFVRRRRRLRGEGRRTAGEIREDRRGRRATSARASGDGRDAGGTRKTGADAGGIEVRDRARRARVLLLRDERGVRGMVRSEEERPSRERLGTVDVPESSTQRERGARTSATKRGRDGLSRRRKSTLRAVENRLRGRRHRHDSCRRPCPGRGPRRRSRRRRRRRDRGSPRGLVREHTRFGCRTQKARNSTASSRVEDWIRARPRFPPGPVSPSKKSNERGSEGIGSAGPPKGGWVRRQRRVRDSNASDPSCFSP